MSQESWKLEQEDAPCTPPAAPSLCSNNCGFFGSSATMNLCSSCYRDLILLKSKSSSPTPALENKPAQDPKEALPPPPPPPPPSSSSPPSSPTTSACSDPPFKEALLCGASKDKAQPLRCFACHKRVGLRGFKCRCGDLFCSLHRYSDEHACSFDYKAAARASIAEANPIVKAEKLHRI